MTEAEETGLKVFAWLVLVWLVLLTVVLFIYSHMVEIRIDAISARIEQLPPAK